MSAETMIVPDVLGAAKNSVESLYAAVATALPADRYTFDMHRVSFIRPYGTLALLCASRLLARRSGQPVTLDRLAPQVHQYLDRIDVFKIGQHWLEPSTVLEEKWSRQAASDRLLEVTIIRGADDVMAIADRARRIFGRCLPPSDQHRLVNVLSELCGNVFLHSGDTEACAVIQRYDYRGGSANAVRVSVADLGHGIRATLQRAHPGLGETPLDFLNAALQGYSSRDRERGGLGLRSVQEIATAGGGHLWIRSETAGILRHTRYPVQRGNLTHVPGTQLAVDLLTSRHT